MQVLTSAFRVVAFPSQLHCHLLLVQGEPEGNPEIFPTTLGSPPWGTAKQQRRKEDNINTLIPNSCQATEESLRFFTLVNQCRALKALRGSCDRSWTLLKSFQWLSWDQNCSLSLGWSQLFLWAHCQLLCKCLQMGYPEFSVAELMRIEDLGVQNVPRDRLEQWWLSWAQACITVWAQQNFLCQTRKVEFCFSSAVPHPCLGWFVLWGQMRLCHEWLKRALSPFLQQWKCDKMAMLLDQLGASLEKWFINLCFWVNHV